MSFDWNHDALRELADGLPMEDGGAWQAWQLKAGVILRSRFPAHAEEVLSAAKIRAPLPTVGVTIIGGNSGRRARSRSRTTNVAKDDTEHYRTEIARVRPRVLELLQVIDANDPVSAVVPLAASSSVRDELRRDPTGHLIAQEHKADIVERRSAQASVDSPLALIRVDLDKFKPVNDTYGHAAGDAVLATVYEAVARTLAGYGVAIRAGGDEVVVLLPNFDVHQALATGERLRRAIQAATIDYEGDLLGVTASIGVAVAPPSETADLEKTADARQRDAKKRGGDCVVGPEMEIE
jgi:diguanylate cyclase (GGDEF)-like protein